MSGYLPEEPESSEDSSPSSFRTFCQKTVVPGYLLVIAFAVGSNAIDNLANDDTEPFTGAWVKSALKNTWEGATGWASFDVFASDSTPENENQFQPSVPHALPSPEEP